MKKESLIILSLLMATNIFAQKGVEDGSRYGHGQDSIKCLENISIYTEYVKTGNYADAYTSWKEVFTDSPLAQSGTYTNGIKIMRWLYQNEKDETKKDAYSQELMDVYEQRIKYLDQLNKLVKNPVSAVDVKSQYAHDYLVYNKKIDMSKAYSMLREIVTEGKGETPYYILGDLMNVSKTIYAKDSTHREAILQDYLDCSNYINDVIAGLDNEQQLEAARKTKDNIDGYFINSRAADCESLQAIYAPKLEENKTNLEFLNKVISVMSMLECTSSDVYFTAAEYAHQLSPSSKSAESMGIMYAKKKNDLDKALEYYLQAIDLEQEDAQKAVLCYKTAFILNQQEKRVQAKSYLQKAIGYNPNYGDSYILLATMYASNHKWCDEEVLNSCTFFVVLDKLQTAKRVDPSVAEKANELIKTYSAYTPNIDDLFMLSIKVGDKVEVKGWINETTTIR